MRFRTIMVLGMVLLGPAITSAAEARPPTIALPGPRYQVIRSGPGSGAHPTRGDQVSIRYVGRLADGSIFSTSAAGGAQPTEFPVKSVIPGFSALVRLMRPGDRWIFFLPAYLAYGPEGKKYVPGDPNLKRDIPADAPLTFDVELVAIRPAQ